MDSNYLIDLSNCNLMFQKSIDKRDLLSNELLIIRRSV